MNEPAEPPLASPERRTSAFLSERSGALLAVLVLIAFFTAGELMHWPVAAVWALLGVEHEGIAFLDLAMLTGAADCASRGIDPYTTAACDPMNRIYNYPPVMLLLAHLGLRQSHTVPAGLALTVAFFASLVWVMRARTLLGHAIVFFAVMSYPVLWGIERANVDLAIFIACVWVCLLLGRPRAGALRQAAAAGIVLLLFLAKLYPIAATTAFWRDRKTLLAALALSTLALLAYVASDPAMFAAVRKLTPSMTERSYGAGVLTGLFYLQSASEVVGAGFVPRPAQLAGYVLSAVALLGAAIVALGRGTAVTKDFDLRPSVNLQLALAGTAIYCLTYCLGTNFNYRLIFLTLAVPYFVQGWEARGHRPSLWLALATVALLLAKWQTHYGFDYRSSEILPTAAELLAFALFVTYSIGLLSYAVTLVKRPTAAR